MCRIITGLLADHPRIDSLILHNGAAIIAGIATCLVAVLDHYYLLMAYGAVFGTFTGMPNRNNSNDGYRQVAAVPRATGRIAAAT